MQGHARSYPCIIIFSSA